MVKTLTCIECPIGCEIEVSLEGGTVSCVKGNGCPRGRAYAEAEVVCPKRVVTSTVRAENGALVPVKTDRPVLKDKMPEVMQKIASATCPAGVKIGYVVIEDVCDGARLVVAGNV